MISREEFSKMDLGEKFKLVLKNMSEMRVEFERMYASLLRRTWDILMEYWASELARWSGERCDGGIVLSEFKPGLFPEEPPCLVEMWHPDVLVFRYGPFKKRIILRGNPLRGSEEMVKLLPLLQEMVNARLGALDNAAGILSDLSPDQKKEFEESVRRR